MIDQFRTVYRGGTGEIVEKKSRFIATVRLVESEEEALSCLEALRKLGVQDGTMAIAGLNPHSGEHGLFG